jgi:hypothetical protein
MNIRLISASAATALGLMLSAGVEARTLVVYAGPAVVYVPPPRHVSLHVSRHVYYAVPKRPTHVTVVRAAPVVVVPARAPKVYVPAPRPVPVTYVPLRASYVAVPAMNVSYAQPVAMVPVAGMR